ncbi:unnamed protein product [Symbiodinium natans]|uniref:Uncharacterized protein n=1 Tax=Symbiodinium natans TaxID=878477 RepID=A0A812REW4_9DINO|nr:unnamed protein product [Symbiodinium natans]
MANDLISHAASEVERTGGVLLRQGGKEFKGVISHGKAEAEDLIFTFGEATQDTIKLAIDKAGKEMRLLSGELAQHAELLVKTSGSEVRMCIDHMEKNVALILDKLPQTAGEVSREAASGFVKGLRDQFGWSSPPSLVVEVSKAIEGQKVLLPKILEAVAVQPESQQKLQYQAFYLLFQTIGTMVRDDFSLQQRFALQFYISAVALRTCSPEQGFLGGYVPGALRKLPTQNELEVFTKDLVKLGHQEHIRTRAVDFLQGIRNRDDATIQDEFFSIVHELLPPRLKQLQSDAATSPAIPPAPPPREACKTRLQKVKQQTSDLKSFAESCEGRCDKDEHVCGTLRQKSRRSTQTSRKCSPTSWRTVT